jgi:hypothetical protein
MEQEILKKIESNEAKIDEVYKSVEKIRKYMLWTAIITVALIVLPAIGLVFVIPQFLDTYTQALNF